MEALAWCRPLSWTLADEGGFEKWRKRKREGEILRKGGCVGNTLEITLKLCVGSLPRPGTLFP